MKKGENLELFLLGGHDLEMVEIIKILEQNCKKFEDKKLKWGAKLSDYKEFLNFEGTIYGIELEEDITSPSNYVEIDHHGKNDHKKSSLEQVAEILGVKLGDDQRLIAANDSRYISGMKSLCAKEEEIDEIRKKDRESQGVTKEDEELALQSFNIAFCDKTNFIFSKTSYFSAVSDLAFYEFDNYIIYNDSKIVFYGYKRENIVEFFKEQNIQDGSYYYGGGEFGFVGIKDNVLTKDGIKKLIDELTKMKKDELYSYHTFMLPFKYKGKESVIENWCKLDDAKVDYNQQAYFHKFFIKSMFDNCEIYENIKYKTFTLKTKDLKKYGSDEIRRHSKIYKLGIEKLSLRIFDDFKVGILSFHLENKIYKDKEEILEINEYGRRIYPEYLDDANNCNLVAEYIKLDDISETFNSKNENNTPIISQIITKLIGDIQPAVDDRMFTISYLNNPKFANEVKENYLCNDKWYEYVFIDGDGKTVQSQTMQEELIKKTTYDRWKDYGTMYGLSRYSFVCLANSDFPLPHMKTMYFSMFSLLLMVRATLLKFADDVSEIAKDIDTKDISGQVNDTYRDYIKFINKYYFREITAKDQGLELYEKALDILKIERDVKDLDAEIEELHRYVDLLEEKERTESMNKISKLGSYLLLPALISSFLGMNIIDFGKYKNCIVSEEVTIAVVIGTVFISAFIMPLFLKSKSYNKSGKKNGN
ncbi:MAG: hypothetical protein WC272_06075 [Sulfurimonas sp.]|jgi:hypothetical protein